MRGWFGGRRRDEDTLGQDTEQDSALEQLADLATHLTSQEEATQLNRELVSIVRRVNRAGGQMPSGAVPAVHEVEDELRPLLDYLQVNEVTEAEMIPVRALVTDYLPTTVDRFIALPPEFAATHRGRHGLTPAQDLLTQLRILAEAAQECALAIYKGDAMELANQGRFLQTKFTRSDLDLG
jgi:hypothetical protein